MEVTLSGPDLQVSETINLNANSDNFKVSVTALVSSDFDGKWNIEYSPNGVDWLFHESMKDQPGNATGNLFYQVPFMRCQMVGGTTGSVRFYIFGSTN